MKNRLVLGVAAVGLSIFGSSLHGWDGYECESMTCCDEGKLLVLSEFLWWTPGNYVPFANNLFENKGLALTAPTAPFRSEVDTFNLPYVRISEKWSPGLRFGLGWETCEGWQLWGVWTGYSNYSRRVLNSTPPAPPLGGTGPLTGGVNEGFIVAPPFGDMFSGPIPARVAFFLPSSTTEAIGLNATATYKLNYNVADLVFGKSLCVWDSLELMPFVGVRSAFIHQRESLKLQGILNEIANGDIIFFGREGANNKGYQDLWAVGPRMGLAATWGDWHGFNLMGTISGAILYGRMEQGYSISTYSTAFADTMIGGLTLTTVTTTGDRYNLIVPNLQVQLGFGYDFEFCLCDTPFAVNWFALWEGNTYWGASNRLLFERQLSLSGLTTGFGISF